MTYSQVFEGAVTTPASTIRVDPRTTRCQTCRHGLFHAKFQTDSSHHLPIYSTPPLLFEFSVFIQAFVVTPVVNVAGKTPRDSIRGDVMNGINTVSAMSLVLT
jgi:hypothetical protein